MMGVFFFKQKTAYEMRISDWSSDVVLFRSYYTAPGIGYWGRHVVEGCFRMWDLAKPLIAQVHGYCLAGGSELASACDLVYVADDAEIGYPPIRLMSPPDNQVRSEEHTSELQSLMRISYAVFCLKKKNYNISTFKHTTNI